MTAATVLVPTHDHGPMLLRSASSVLAQSAGDFELFVIGDGVPDVTREIMAELSAADDRVRFFDHPKGPRNGELYRHAALQEARGEIVCYLSDDDLWLPGHLEEMRRLLADADAAHTLSFAIGEEGLYDVTRVDLSRSYDREVLLGGDSRIHLSITGHTLELYRRLPAGWRTTPAEIYTDLYMWQQLLSVPDCKVVSGTRPTVLHLPSSMRVGWSKERRFAELDAWAGSLADPAKERELMQRLIDVMAPDRARLEEVTVNQEQSILRLQEREADLDARVRELDRELAVVSSSLTWRLRERLLGVPGLRSALRAAAGALARRGAPAATAPSRPAPTPVQSSTATGSPAPDPPSDSPARRSDPSTR